MINRYCLPCHTADAPEGNVVLEHLSGTLTTESQATLADRVLRVLRFEKMPPPEYPQPSVAEKRQLRVSLKQTLRQYVRDSSAPAPMTRRLTNREYENTIRDLIGFHLKLKDRLPEDPVRPYRFHNTPDMMQLGPEQMDRYLECARRVMAATVVDSEPPQISRTQKSWKPTGTDRGLGADEVGVWGNRRDTAARGMNLTSFPKHGEYRIRVTASAILPKDCPSVPLRLVMGYGGLEENQSTHRITPVGTVSLDNSPDEPRVIEFRGRIENHPPRPPRMHRNRVIPETMTITPQNLYDDGTLNDDNDFSRTRNIAMPRVVIHQIEFEAPLTDTWPPAHHTRILFESAERQTDPEKYLRKVLRQFLSRAYRRPAEAEEVGRFEKIFRLVQPTSASFEAAVRETLSYALISPQFLYHTSTTSSADTGNRTASRLSYFLWGTMPDETLRTLAAEGSLADESVIDRQTERLLNDERSDDFVRDFVLQWLSLQKMQTVPINRDLFPRFLYYVPRGERAGTEEPYRPTIRDYMLEETVRYFRETIRRNLPVDALVDSDFACLNQPLAAHYKTATLSGLHLRTVKVLPEHHLGGLLTHGSILLGNSTGSAPHPIYRAVWLREAILGEDVPPPPADVPALSDSAGESADHAATISDLLRLHRQADSCRHCHAHLDPWGLPFEQYNAIGQYQPRISAEGIRIRPFNREKDVDISGYRDYLDSIATVSVNAAAELPDGGRVNGLQELKEHLLTHRREDIAENLLRRFLAYALGRDLTYRDRFIVQALFQESRAHNHRIRDMIRIICRSPVFRGAPDSEVEAWLENHGI